MIARLRTDFRGCTQKFLDTAGDLRYTYRRRTDWAAGAAGAFEGMKAPMRKKYYLAIDIGASAGRHVVGWREETGETGMDEVYRFPNSVERLEGHLIWDMEHLLEEVRTGIDAAQEKYPWIESFSIDAWAADYVLMRRDQPSLSCYAYRDGRTEDAVSRVHELVPFEELYQRTGVRFRPFNTVYQLCADQMAGRLEKVTDFLMIPEYLMYRLTGVKRHEYTIAATTGLVSAGTGKYDMEMVKRLGLPKQFFGPLAKPGTVIGEYKNIRAVLCAAHNIASAVEGIPMEDNQPYIISSDDGSLLGVKTDRPLLDSASRDGGWSNEGGVGYYRCQKNLVGTQLIDGLRRELCPDMPFPEIDRLAEESGCQRIVDANAPEFCAPEGMKAAFDNAAAGGLNSIGDYFRCAYRSLAEIRRAALEELERNTGRTYDRIYAAGGGESPCLIEMTREASGKEVVVLPIQAAVLGNLSVQMKADCE